MIRFACPSCGSVFTANDDKGGKTGTCSKCKAQFIIPEAANPTAPPPPPKQSPPPPPKSAPQPAPVARVIRSDAPTKRPEKDEDDRPRSRLFDDDGDDRPRRRSGSSGSRRDEEDDDRPRRRPESRRDDDDDRPRRRPQRDDYDDDYDRPRRKKQNPAILTGGILFILASLALLTFAIIDISSTKGLGDSPFRGRGNLDLLPKELRDAVSQMETALVFLQISQYAALLAGIACVTAGVGLLVQLQFGRIAGFVASGLGALGILCLLIGIILVYTTSIMGKSPPATTKDVLNSILRFVLMLIPIIVTVSILFRRDVVKKLR